MICALRATPCVPRVSLALHPPQLRWYGMSGATLWCDENSETLISRVDLEDPQLCQSEKMKIRAAGCCFFLFLLPWKWILLLFLFYQGLLWSRSYWTVQDLFLCKQCSMCRCKPSSGKCRKDSGFLLELQAKHGVGLKMEGTSRIGMDFGKFIHH